MSEISDTLASLGAKLDSLDLTDAEQTALRAILDAAEDEGAHGFTETIPPIRHGEVILWRSYMPRLVDVVESRICPTCGSLAEACWCAK